MTERIDAILGLVDEVDPRIVEVIDPTTSDPMFWPEVATVDLVDDGDTFSASVAIDQVIPWTRVCLAATVRYPPEATTLEGAVVLDPELTATGLQPDHTPSPWGPHSVPAWIEVAGPEPTLTPGTDPGQVSVTVSGLPELPTGQPTWTVTFLSGTSALTTTTSIPVRPASPTAVLGPPSATTRYAAQLVDPFGAPRTPLML